MTVLQSLFPLELENHLVLNKKRLNVGSDAWCEELLGRRVGKARALLSAIGRFPDAQGAFSLLRSCSGWSKVMYSCRTVPPDAQMCGLRTADNDLRAALGQLIGRPVTAEDWRLASLGVAAGGLGARCAAEHAPADTSPAFLLVVSCAAGFGPLSIPLIWTKVAAWRRLRMSCAVRSLLEPTSTLSATPLPRSPCLGWLRLSLFLLSLGTPPFLGIAACTLRLAGSLIDSHIFLPHFSAWLSSVVFAYRYGIATRLAACAGSSRPLGRSRPCLLLWGSGFAP